MSVFVIAEAGSNWWNGPGESELKRADRVARLVEIAADAGADAVKFQFWRPGDVYAPDAGHYRGKSVNAMFDELALPEPLLRLAWEKSQEFGIEFMCSVFEPEDVDFVDPLVKRHKIASYELGHERLVRRVATTLKPMIVSTGASTHEERCRAFDWIADATARRKPDVTFLYCVAAYPAERVRLRDMVAADRPVPFGFSDHTLSPVVIPVAAVAMGAKVLEKHFTVARSLSGPDHRFALGPKSLKKMVMAVRQAEANINGSASDESELRDFAVRCVVATRDLAPGSVIEPGDVVARRPGERRRGAHASRLSSVIGRVVGRGVRAWDGIAEDDLE